MRFADFFVLLLALVLLGIGGYIVWINVPLDGVEYIVESVNGDELTSDFEYSFSENLQFYPNMRYKDRRISYFISRTCDFDKIQRIEKALSALSVETNLEFYSDSAEPEITYVCSKLAPKPENTGHYVAGEGGPTEVVNGTRFSIILAGEVSLFREEVCSKPNVAIHETLHALGFDHINDEKSILYPVSKCNQVIDKFVIEEINRMYSLDALPDVYIESVSASKPSRKYLNFEATISNVGLEDAKNARLLVSSEDGLIKEIELGEIKVGSKKFLNVGNLKTSSRGSDKIIFEVKLENQKELHTGNNKVSLTLKES